MKKITRTLLLATSILFTQTSAQAIIFLYRTGFYLAGSGSVDWNLSNDVFVQVDTGGGNVTRLDGSVTPATGFNGNAAIGYYMDQWRLEAEANYRNKKDTPFWNNGVLVTDFGYVSQFSVMANVYYDMPICVEWCGFFLGAGVGCAFSEIVVKERLKAFEHDARFAAQVMAGSFYNVTKCVAFTLMYRLFATTAPRDVFFTDGATSVYLDSRSAPIIQSVELGIRISL